MKGPDGGPNREQREHWVDLGRDWAANAAVMEDRPARAAQPGPHSLSSEDVLRATLHAAGRRHPEPDGARFTRR